MPIYIRPTPQFDGVLIDMGAEDECRFLSSLNLPKLQQTNFHALPNRKNNMKYLMPLIKINPRIKINAAEFISVNAMVANCDGYKNITISSHGEFIM